MAVPFPFVANAVLTAAQMNAITSLPTTAKTASATLTAAEAVGYRVTMTSATATTITINTAVFATGDTVFITNLGAGVCTVTAGTATVSSAGSLAIPQYGSGVLVMTATGTGIYYPSAAGNAVNTVASASSIAVTGDGTYLLTGTTTVATITGGTTGMTITVQASAQASGVPVVLTYGAGANAIKLAGGRSLGIYAQVPADAAAGAGESVTLRYDGTAWVEIDRDLRTVLDYVQGTAQTNITGTSEAGATLITGLTTSTLTLDGATPIDVEAFAPLVSRGNSWIKGALYDNIASAGAASIGFFSSSNGPSADIVTTWKRRYTPTAATHVWSMRAWVDAGTGIVYAGAGGSGANMPAYVKISRSI